MRAGLASGSSGSRSKKDVPPFSFVALVDAVNGRKYTRPVRVALIVIGVLALLNILVYALTATEIR